MSIILDGANDKLQVVTSAAADIEVQASYVENNAGTITPKGDPVASITTATTTDIIAAPGSSKQFAVTYIALRNNHGATSCDVTVQETDATNTVTIAKATLLAGESLICDEVGGWTHYDVNMGAYPALGNIATQAEMEAGTSTSVVVTPGREKYHPGVAKFWAQVTGAGTPALTTSYGVTSVADTGVGRMTVTLSTSFSSANWCCQVSVFTSNATADEGIPNVNAKAAGTVEVGNRVITPAAGDPAVGYDVAGWGDQ